MVRREHGRGTAGKTLFHLIDGDKCVYLKMILGNSLVIQELREHFAFTAGVHIQFLARALRSCKPHSMAEKKKRFFKLQIFNALSTQAWFITFIF